MFESSKSNKDFNRSSFCLSFLFSLLFINSLIALIFFSSSCWLISFLLLIIFQIFIPSFSLYLFNISISSLFSKIAYFKLFVLSSFNGFLIFSIIKIGTLFSFSSFLFFLLLFFFKSGKVSKILIQSLNKLYFWESVFIEFLSSISLFLLGLFIFFLIGAIIFFFFSGGLLSGFSCLYPIYIWIHFDGILNW